MARQIARFVLPMSATMVPGRRDGPSSANWRMIVRTGVHRITISDWAAAAVASRVARSTTPRATASSAIAARRALLDALRPTTTTLLQHLSLLFVPAGVGVMVHGRRLADEGVAIVVALVLSTVLALAATALTVHALWPRGEDDAR